MGERTSEGLRTPTSGVVVCAMHQGPGWKRMQDYAGCRDLGGCKVLAVADGVSASPHAEQAARTAVEVALEVAEAAWREHGRVGRGPMSRAFGQAGRKIAALSKERGWSSSPETTLIMIVETPQRLAVSYVGDGAVVLAVASGNYGLLLPHIGHGGFLTRVIRGERRAKPAYLEIDKGWPEGEIVLAGTDGVFAPGQTLRIAREILFALRDRFRADGGLTAESAQETLLDYISRLNSDDNRAVGVILTREALAHWVGRSD